MSETSSNEIPDLNLLPTISIVVTEHNDSLPPAEASHRAAHKIRLSALCNNYSAVESAANRQRCSVIVVVKGGLKVAKKNALTPPQISVFRFCLTYTADGYGHGAIR